MLARLGVVLYGFSLVIPAGFLAIAAWLWLSTATPEPFAYPVLFGLAIASAVLGRIVLYVLAGR